MEREGEVARRVRVFGVIGFLRGTSRGGILRKLHRNLVLSFVIMFSVFFFLIDFSLNSIFFTGYPSAGWRPQISKMGLQKDLHGLRMALERVQAM